MKLTPDQTRAVKAEGSVAVTAGAGTGKTAMLAKRYTHHVVEHKLSPLEIVAATFTDKAAAELRSRIREEMQKTGDDKQTAEIDAAQISTIHSLAARICRDFYDIVGIPADFTMMDETESAMRSVIWFRDAVSVIHPEIIDYLGYSWLFSALNELFKDPISSAEALEHRDVKWKNAIEAARNEAVLKLQRSDAWRYADRVLDRYWGAVDDKLEVVRQNVIRAMSDIAMGQGIKTAFDAFTGFRSNGGAAKNWPDGGLDEIRACLTALRDDFKVAKETLSLEFGEAEVELGKRLEYLTRAFDQAREQISAFKLREKVLDYSDLEYYALKVLENEDARKYYSDRWRAILIDEFQDTNPVQEKLLRQLTGSARLTVVGDEKQSIYGFRRADVAVFGRFKEEIGDTVNLGQSFRTHHRLVASMNAVFSVVLGELHQELEAERREAPHNEIPIKAAAIIGETGENAYSLRRVEADYIAAEIRRMLDEQMPVFDKQSSNLRPIRPGDIALLSRARAPLDIYIDALLKAGVPAVNTGGGNLLETRTVKDAMAVLAFASDRTDDIALVTVLRSPFFSVSDRVLFELAGNKDKGQTWWSVINSASGGLGPVKVAINKLLDAARTSTPVRLLEIIDEMTGYTAVISNLSQGSRRMADWLGFMSLLRRFAAIGRSDVLGAARYAKQLIDAEAKIPRPPIDAGDAVSLMTIHGSKGLEWPVVFVPDLARKRPSSFSTLSVDNELGVAFDFEMPVATDGEDSRTLEFAKADPSILRLIKQRRKDRELEETKRVLYVAITRARDRVFLTAAGEKGPDIDLLIPGLESAGIPVEPVQAAEFRLQAQTPNVHLPALKDGASAIVFQLDPVFVGLRKIPVTALTEYSVCPRRFRFNYVDGHPGLGEGSAHGRTVGSLTHTALELELKSIDELRPFADAADDVLLAEAIGLAQNFNTNEAFAAVRELNIAREESITLTQTGITMTGIADLIGDDFVLDYKTDSEIDPEHHRFQLWAYAEALNKPKAYIAYLRHDTLHEFGQEELMKIKTEAAKLLEGVFTGNYEPKPSEVNCGRCVFNTICDASAVQS
jgi:ATP-dependent helicase/nuclease subunit A